MRASTRYVEERWLQVESRGPKVQNTRQTVTWYRVRARRCIFINTQKMKNAKIIQKKNKKQ